MSATRPSVHHGFPPKIRIPQQRSTVRVLMKDGVPCNDVIEVKIPAKTVGMRDKRKRSGTPFSTQ